jgi:acid phosphatase
MTDVVAKMKGSTSDKIEGELSFLNHWNMFFDGTTPLAIILFSTNISADPINELEQLTKTGPYAGSLESFTTGVKFRTRYYHLIEHVESASTPMKVWAASGTRVQATADYFALGLFGLNASRTSEVVVIPEDPSRGGNTLTPADTCVAYTSDSKNGHDLGDASMVKFRVTYLKPVATRIRKQLALGRHVKIDFTDDEVYSMQEMCGFETIARGKSPWCDVFSKDEWESCV